MESFESQVSNELFTISNDVKAIKRVLMSLLQDMQLNMTYCDVLSTILEENGLTTTEEVREMTMSENKKRELESKKILKNVYEKLDDIVDEQEALKELIRTSNVTGEA